jgi:hypothetical protein
MRQELQAVRAALAKCGRVLSLGYQTGPYAYAGENMAQYMADAADAARTALAAKPTQAQEKDAARHQFKFGPNGYQCQRCGKIWCEVGGVPSKGDCAIDSAIAAKKE